MLSTTLLPLVALVNIVSAIPTPDTASPYKRQSSQSCVEGDAVHIIVARGSTQEPGEGSLIQVSDLIEAAIPGSDSIGVLYPAELFPYGDSQDVGVQNMTQMIKDYHTSCPDSHIVLLGYSQGGHIVGDVLGGATYSDTLPLESSVSDAIVAAVSFASPAHVEDKPYNAGTASKSGIFSRDDTTALDAFASSGDRYLDICDKGDLFCDSGLSIDTHTMSVEKNAELGANFVVEKATA